MIVFYKFLFPLLLLSSNLIDNDKKELVLELNINNKNITLNNSYENININIFEINEVGVSIIPNPASNLIAVQIKDLITNNLDITLYDINGKVIKHKKIYAGSTIAYFNVQTLYNGIYLVRISSKNHTTTKRVIISR